MRVQGMYMMKVIMDKTRSVEAFFLTFAAKSQPIVLDQTGPISLFFLHTNACV